MSKMQAILSTRAINLLCKLFSEYRSGALTKPTLDDLRDELGADRLFGDEDQRLSDGPQLGFADFTPSFNWRFFSFDRRRFQVCNLCCFRCFAHRD